MAKKLFRYTALAIFPLLASLFIRLIYATNKKVFHIPASVGEEPIIFACWHGELLMLPYLYKRYRKKAHAKVLISEHFDGKLIAKTISYFGLDTVHGSTTRGASRVLLNAIKAIREGYDIGITPDGPKGPRHSVGDGVVVMAQKTGTKVVLVEIKASKKWVANSWDRFVIPKPFGTLTYYATPPLDLSSYDLVEAKEIIRSKLLKHSDEEHN